MPPVGAIASGRFAVLLKRLTVVSIFAIVLGAPVEEVEDRARQAPLRETSQIRDIHRPGEVGHNCGSLYL